MTRLLRILLPLGAVAALAVGTRAVRLHAFAEHQSAQRYEDVYYLPGAAWLPVMSLGYQQALADVLWCQSLVYFGEELSQRGAVKFVFEYTDAILTLDPSFREAYRWIGTAALYRPTATTTREIGERTASYLKRAVERWPDDGELHWEYGSLLRFELAPIAQDAAYKRSLLERAAPHLALAARAGAGPPWLALNNAALFNKLGQTDQAIRHLEDLRGTVQDESVRQDIDAQLQRLRTSSYLEAMEAAEQELERQHQSSYPYLSEGLFFLLGGRAAPLAGSSAVTRPWLDEQQPLDEAEGTPLGNR